MDTGTDHPHLEVATPDACPRCSGSLDGQEFYGVCGECQTQLRRLHAGERRSVSAGEYEPKMNVTPNAVASKD